LWRYLSTILVQTVFAFHVGFISFLITCINVCPTYIYTGCSRKSFISAKQKSNFGHLLYVSVTSQSISLSSHCRSKRLPFVHLVLAEIPKFCTTTSQFFCDLAHRFQVQQLDVAEVRCAQKAIIPAGDHGMMAFAKRIKRHRTPFLPCSHFLHHFFMWVWTNHTSPRFVANFFLGLKKPITEGYELAKGDHIYKQCMEI
jgi:hypothetical protein